MLKADGTHIVGIDLGTTYSLVADIRDGKTVILSNGLGEGLTASAVSLDDNGVFLVGKAAKARSVRVPELSAVTFKRDMGTDRTYTLGTQKLTPVELSALVLKQLKVDAESALGATVTEAVITVPAYFGDAQRRATREAAQLAGLIAERIINEPTAAALAYGFHRRAESAQLIVLDLGGGTFDVTLLRLTDGIIEVAASAGDTRLGGEDFTRALVELLAPSAGARLDDVNETAQLTEACDSLKIALTTRLQSSVSLSLASGVKDLSLTRLDAERAWAPLLTRLEAPIQQALRDGGVKGAELDGVLVVGGASRMPCVVELARRVIGKEPMVSLPQDEAIALGAVVQAALKIGDASVDDMVATDIAPFSLGIGTSTHVRGSMVNGVFTPILERGTVLPASRKQVFSTIHPDQTEILVQVFQGEHAMVARNSKLGELRIDKLPKGQINGIDVRFSYDLNGILEVEVLAHATGKQHSTVITNGLARVSPADIEAARKRFERLKIHPRETLPNRTALEVAETAYTNLLGERRQALGAAIAHFRGLLDEEDASAIGAFRRRLMELVGELKASPE